ncbi:MAG: oligosaccharyl transferase, archaeosortase A system-associated, partial [Methanoregulaceae archaeon]|nr:oligosaccharyl transferase, archaeosortase A system-associated [Methanoregulaceae archaeon]
IGFIVLAYMSWKQERPDRHYILIWSIIIFVATWQHVRYEYYLASNLAILAGVCIGFFLDLGMAGLCIIPRREASGSSASGSAEGERTGPPSATQPGDQKGQDTKAPSSESPEGKGGVSRQPSGRKGSKGAIAKAKKAEADQKSAQRSQKRQAQKKKEAGPKPDYVKLALLSAILIFTGLFVYLSLVSELAVADSTAIRMNPDWRESMEWMRNNTPDTGVDYYKIYNGASFSYPPQSYGVMSWWDYGHLTTYIAHRIPNANPFQAGVAGPTGSAAFFMAPDESKANSILTTLGTRYVVTDIEMDTGKFWAMATWYNSTLGATPYHPIFLIPSPENPQQLQDVMILDDAYYQTMVSRLHNFDGSMTEPTNAVYIEYTDAVVAGQPLPVISDVLPVEGTLNVTNAQATAASYNANAAPGYHAVVGNPAWSSILDPVASVPALQHYRLVHESPNNVFQVQAPDVRYVKTFEFVPGAHIKGDGIIELDLVSDGGRSFTYRQASVNGEFIVPYSTAGNPYGVKAVGKYRILGTGREFDVPESAVQSGVTIQA